MTATSHTTRPDMDQVRGTTRRLATWATHLGYDDLTEADRAHAKMLVLDYLRALALGSRTPSSLAARRAMSAWQGTPTSTVLVFGDRTDSARAALVNGSLAHATDIDDTHVAAMLHPGASVLPAAIAVSEEHDRSGRDLIPALVAGYETAVRISEALQPAHFRRGFQATGTCGALGAAVAAARVRGFDSDVTAGALGVAGSLAGGLAQFYYSGSEVKRVHAGLAAHNGVLAAQLAGEGVVGPTDVLEGAAGFAVAYADGLPERDLLDGVGERLAIHDVVIKPHATSARLQAAVEATLHLVGPDPVSPADVSDVEIDIPEVIAGRLTQPDPPDVTAAQMSLPFTVALAVVASHDRGTPLTALRNDDYREYLDDVRVRQLAGRVMCRVDEQVSRATQETGAVPANVTITTPDGPRRQSVAIPLGAPARPVDRTEHHKLFRASVDGRMDEATQDIVVDAVENLERPGALTEMAQRFILKQPD